jgi:hypothetical protein
MKLHELLNEVELITDISKTEKKWADGHPVLGKKLTDDPRNGSITARGKLEGGTWLMFDSEHHDYIGPDVSARYLVTALNDVGKVQCTVSLNKVGKSYQISHLVAKNKSTIPAHKLYAAFVKAGNTLTTSSQSEGGVRVWQKLSKEPGIVVHGWNTRAREPINLGPSFDDTSDTHSNIDAQYSAHDHDDAQQRQHEYDLEHNVLLVATTKK